MKCEICGEDFKNLGVHMRVHKTTQDYTTNLTIDVPKEKPLSELVAEMKKLLRPYRFMLKVSYEEEDVDKTFLEITARIHYRR